MERRTILKGMGAAAAAGLLPSAVRAQAEPIKIGLILPMTGPFTSTGKQIAAAANLYVAQKGNTIAGRRVELILKDDTGVADVTRRLAQELIVNDKVTALAGFGLTPLALATAPVATQGKTPMVVMAAATSIITERSPFIVRTSQVVPQIAAPFGTWVAQQGIKRVVTMVSRISRRGMMWKRRSARPSRRPVARPRRCAFRSRTRISRPSCSARRMPSPMRSSSSCHQAKARPS